MDENNSIIYGLEFQARALTSQQADSNDDVIFFVATQSLKPNNQIHKIKLNEDTCKLDTAIFSHSFGEVWKLNASPHDSQTLASCYSSMKANNISMETALIRLPDEVTHENNQDFLTFQEKNTEILKTHAYGNEIKTTEFHPENRNLLACVIDAKILVFNCCEAQTIVVTTMELHNSKSEFVGGKWSKHNSNQFIALHECSVRSYDIRDSNNCSWIIEDAHGQQVRDLDCNANKSHHIVTGGDDGKIKIWDARNTKEAVFARKDHNHWVFCVRFNSFHDQLLLSSSSDGKVLLTCAASVSSEAENTSIRNRKNGLQDGLLHIFDQHEDSVYAVEWSNATSSVFASLSYDGRVCVTKLPNQYKYRISTEI